MTVSAEDLQWFSERYREITDNIERVIQGKRETIELITMCLLASGHALIEDVPGVGKTLLAKSLARSIDCSFQRIQFTPDLLPSDVTGVSVWDRDSSNFVFRAGPVFANVVLGDEINRASPKTQSALLEAMEERQVTVDAVTRPLDLPFIVVATQNPIEHEGTYPLPEAQLDRFMMRITMGYPSRDKELEMLDTHGDHSTYDDLQAVVHADDITRMSAIARRIHVAGCDQVLSGRCCRCHPQRPRTPPRRVTTRHPLPATGRPGPCRYVRTRLRLPRRCESDAPPRAQPSTHPQPEAQMRGVTIGDIVSGIAQGVDVPGTKAGV